MRPLDPRPADPTSPWGTTLALSILLHAAGFGAALALPRLMPVGASGPPVYVVDLVALPAGNPAEPAAPPPGGAAGRKEPPPKPEKSITIPDRNARKPEPKKTPPPKKEKAETLKKKEEARATPSPAASRETATGASAEGTGRPGAPPGPPGMKGSAGSPGGGAGGTGAEQADAATFYANLLRQRIEGAWARPIYPPGWTSHQDPTASIRIALTSSGRVATIDLVAASGYDAMDRSILRAVQDAQPFPPFPYQLGRDSLTVTIDFVLPPK